MRAWTRTALALLSLGAVTSGAAAQEDLVGLDKAHQLLAEGQARAAARQLATVSAEFRGEIGRCRDQAIGAKLMELEPRIDALLARINAGTLTSAADLAPDFLAIDRLLAANHHQLAAQGWSVRRFGRVEVVAKDLALAARYAERAGRWSTDPMPAASRAVIADALAMAARLAADPANPPAEAGPVIEALGRLVR